MRQLRRNLCHDIGYDMSTCMRACLEVTLPISPMLRNDSLRKGIRRADSERPPSTSFTSIDCTYSRAAAAVLGCETCRGGCHWSCGSSLFFLRCPRPATCSHASVMWRYVGNHLLARVWRTPDNWGRSLSQLRTNFELSRASCLVFTDKSGGLTAG
ncbi:hypothetical protein BKA93DRAFT_113899 [Sparassis latifolia]